MNDEIRRITEKNIMLEIQLEEEREDKNVCIALIILAAIALFLMMAFPDKLL